MNVVGLIAFSILACGVLGLGALLLEDALASIRRPTRWIWVGILGGTLWVSATTFLKMAEPLGSPAASPADVQEGPIYRRVAVLPANEPAGHDRALLDLIGDLNRRTKDLLSNGMAVLPAWRLAPNRVAQLWATLSCIAALLIGGSLVRLFRRRRLWTEEEMAGRRVWVSSVTGPATIGLSTPRIVMPKWTKSLSGEDLEMILRHEEEHVRSHDPRILVAGLMAFVLCPWNPVVLWMVRRLKQAVEIDCDQRLLRRGIESHSYGGLLVRIGSRSRHHSRLVPTINGSPSLLERRLTKMQHQNRRAAFVRAIGLAMPALLLVAAACTAEAPVEVARTAQPTPEADRSVNVGAEGLVEIWVDQSGTVEVNGVVRPMDQISSAVAPLYSDDTIVSIEAHQAAPYAVLAALQDQLREAGLLRVVFINVASGADRSPREAETVVDQGLALVLPGLDMPDMRQIEATHPANLFIFEVLPGGTVAARHAGTTEVNEISPRDVEEMWLRQVAGNASLIAVVRTHPETEYRYMYDVLGALRRADATRLSLQIAE